MCRLSIDGMREQARLIVNVAAADVPPPGAGVVTVTLALPAAAMSAAVTSVVFQIPPWAAPRYTVLLLRGSTTIEVTRPDVVGTYGVEVGCGPTNVQAGTDEGNWSAARESKSSNAFKRMVRDVIVRIGALMIEPFGALLLHILFFFGLRGRGLGTKQTAN